jgi:hypothetical protein
VHPDDDAEAEQEEQGGCEEVGHDGESKVKGRRSDFRLLTFD